MSDNESAAARRASQLFRKETQLREGEVARKEYTEAQEATLRKTARLKEQRLARDAVALMATPAPKLARKTTSRRV